MIKFCGVTVRPAAIFTPILFASLLSIGSILPTFHGTASAAEQKAGEANSTSSAEPLQEAPEVSNAAPIQSKQEANPIQEGRDFLADYTGRALKSIQIQGLPPAERDTRIRALIQEGFDIDHISAFVLGRYRSNLSDEQLTEFRDIYLEYILASYSNELSALGKVDFNLVDAKAGANGSVNITSEVKRDDGPPVRVGWEVRNNDGTSWKIVDVKAEGVSLIVTQRAEFNSVLRNTKYDGLLKALKKKIKVSKARNSQ